MYLSVLGRFFLLVALLGGGFAEAADATYDAGIAAFRAGRYDDALAQFTAAYEAGASSPQLYYNLGSVQFRRGDYAAAYRWFETLLTDPQWRALAHYNLGLIDERRQRSAAAEGHFEAAWQMADTAKLKQLAALKLGRAQTPDRNDDWSGIASLAAGYDDNVVLLNDQSLVSVSNQGDYFAEALAGAGRFVSGTLENGWRADAAGYYRRYNDQHDYDFGSATVGIYRSRVVAEQAWQIGGRVEAQVVGGHPYATAATLRAQLLRSAGPFLLRLRNDLSYIDGADDFGYLTGWRDRFSAQLSRTLGRSRLRLGYEFEVNDCRDETTTTGFFSYSPLWNRFYGEVIYAASAMVELEGRVEYGISRYRDDNVETNPDGSVTRAARDDDRIAASLRATYHPTPTWGAFAEYTYTDNSSRWSAYEYTDNQFLLGIERTF